MIIKFDTFESNNFNLNKYNIFLFHGSNIGKMDYCKEFIIKEKNIKDKKIDIVNLHTEELKKGEFLNLYRKHNQPNIFGNPTALNIYLNNEKFSKEIVSALSEQVSQNLIIFKSDQLPPKSLLRSFFEKENNLIVVPCYEESAQEKINYISKLLTDNHIKISHEKIRILSENLPNQRLDIKNEMEKIIILYKSNPQISFFSNIDEYISDNLNIDDSTFIYSIVSGKSDSFFRKYNSFTDYGNDNVRLLSYLLEHLFRLLIVKYKVKQGSTVRQAIKDLRPPVFFKYHKAFNENLNHRNISEIWQMFEKLMLCKKSFIENRPSSNYYFCTTIIRFLKPQRF